MSEFTPLIELKKRLEADGGRYLLTIAKTPEEIQMSPPPTYGGKERVRSLKKGLTLFASGVRVAKLLQSVRQS